MPAILSAHAPWHDGARPWELVTTTAVLFMVTPDKYPQLNLATLVTRLLCHAKIPTNRKRVTCCMHGGGLTLIQSSAHVLCIRRRQRDEYLKIDAGASQLGPIYNLIAMNILIFKTPFLCKKHLIFSTNYNTFL
jgi:hypothetical protein